MKTTLYIQNLKCGGCATTIYNKLSAISIISQVKVSIEENAVSFEYSDDLALNNAKETLKSSGYPEVSESNTLGTKAKSYISCAMGKMS